MSNKIELDPDDREWEYDGDGAKIYKLEAGKPHKTPLREVDLDGGVPLEKNYLRESEVVSFKMNGEDD